MENFVEVEKAPEKVSAALQAHRDLVTAAYAEVDDSTIAAAAALASPDRTPGVAVIDSRLAAAILFNHHGKNRPLSLAKVIQYNEAMSRGEWEVTHQGIAFYKDGTVCDGQHRLNAIIAGNHTESFLVVGGMDKSVIDVIDRGARRNAGESLEMGGVTDGKLKATIAKRAIEYTTEVDDGRKQERISDIQIEGYVSKNMDLLDAAIHIGKSSRQNVTDPAMKVGEAALVAYLMMAGGFPEFQVTGFIASIQQGVATYPEAPTVELSRKLTRSNLSKAPKDKLTSIEVIALSMKAAPLWVNSACVSKLVWNKAKEKLPTYHHPSDETAEAA